MNIRKLSSVQQSHFKEVLIILVEGGVVHLVDQLNDPNDLAGHVLDGHAEDGFGTEICPLIHLLKSRTIPVNIKHISQTQVLSRPP